MIRTKMMAGSFLAAALALITAVPCAYAGDVHSLSVNAAVQSDYRTRGISQTGEDPAVSGGVDYAYNPIGAYLGAWASTVDFNGCVAPCTDSASLEVDLYVGIAGELPGGVGWDVAGYYYLYPGQNEEGETEYDYVEVSGKLSYTLADSPLEPTLGAAVYYTPRYSGDAGDAYYVNASLDLALPEGFSMGAEIGWQDVQDYGDYVHWRVGLGYSFKALNLDLSYHDAASSCERVSGARTLCDGALVFTVSTAIDIF